MARLIDADALINEAGKLWSEMPDGEELSKELMKAINHAPTIGGWISVKDRLPEEYGPYLVALETRASKLKIKVYVWTGNSDEDYWRGAEAGSRITTVTHWMPLPEPPKEEH